MSARRNEGSDPGDRNNRPAATGENARGGKRAPLRRPYSRPQVTDGEPLVNVTLLSGGANPSSQTPFVP